MARVIVALMRHGVYEQPPGTPSAHLPHPLKAKGKRQARAAAALIAEICRKEGWVLDSTVDCSPLLRSWQSALVAADEFTKILGEHYSCEAFEALMERGLGAAANLTLAEIATAVETDPRLDNLPDDWKLQPHFRLPLHGAESLMDSGQRVRDHLVERCAQLKERDHDTLKLFVGHGGCYRHAAVHLGALTIEEVSGLSMHYGGFVLLEECEQASWQKIGGEWKVRSAADIHMRGS